MVKKFDKSFKEEAVKLVTQSGLTVRQASKDLSIGQSTLTKWVGEYRKHGESESLSVNEKEELKQLRKEVSILKQERDILKKASAYFAKLTV